MSKSEDAKETDLLGSQPRRRSIAQFAADNRSIERRDLVESHHGRDLEAGTGGGGDRRHIRSCARDGGYKADHQVRPLIVVPRYHEGRATLVAGKICKREPGQNDAAERKHLPGLRYQVLALSILPMFQEPGTATALLLESIALAFHAHVVHRYGDGLRSEASVRTGLVPWQLRSACAYIDAHLSDAPSVSDLARECRLSASHFARAFRQATGMPPHRWVMKRRIERAKELLLEGELDLAELALACGFADQSHFTRTYGRSERHSPGKWRRLRRN